MFFFFRKNQTSKEFNRHVLQKSLPNTKRMCQRFTPMPNKQLTYKDCLDLIVWPIRFVYLMITWNSLSASWLKRLEIGF